MLKLLRLLISLFYYSNATVMCIQCLHRDYKGNYIAYADQFRAVLSSGFRGTKRSPKKWTLLYDLHVLDNIRWFHNAPYLCHDISIILLPSSIHPANSAQWWWRNKSIVMQDQICIVSSKWKISLVWWFILNDKLLFQKMWFGKGIACCRLFFHICFSLFINTSPFAVSMAINIIIDNVFLWKRRRLV